MKNKFFFSILAFALICIQLWFLYLIFTYPSLGVSMEQQERERWVISEFQIGSHASKIGIEINDTLLKVNDIDANEYFSVKKWRTLDQAKKILLSRNGQQIEIEDIPYLSMYGTTPLLIGEILCLVIAFLLYKRTQNSSSAKFLSFVFLNFSLIYMSLGASTRGDALGKNLVASLLMLLPVLFLHFFIVFIKERGGIDFSSKFLKYLYIFVFLAFLTQFVYYLPANEAYHIYKIVGYISPSFFILGLILNFGLLSYVYLKNRHKKNYMSKLIQTIWISLLISFLPIVCFSLIPILVIGHDLVNSFNLAWFILFFPLSFAYLIVTKQLYDIQTVLRRILMTTIMAAIPSAVLTAFLSFVFQDTSINNILMNFIVTTVVFSYSLYSLEFFMKKFEPILFPRKHLLQTALKKIAKNLKYTSTLVELKNAILVDIVQTLEVNGGCIVLNYRNKMEIISEGDIPLFDVERIVSKARNTGRLEHPEYTCFEITRDEKYSCYLFLTKKKDNTMLNLEEIQWLNLIISYLAVSLENVYLVRKLTARLEELAAQISTEKEMQELDWFRKMMFELQEKERTRIAHDLQDTTMQDLFLLKGKLTTLIAKHEENSKTMALESDEIEQIKSIVDYMEVINVNLRQSCFELHPHLLQEIGLVKTVQKLVEQESYLCPFGIEFLIQGADTIERRDMETKKHLFRIIQELLNNAKKHSQASKVKLSLEDRSDGLYLLYEDNGIGFEMDNRPLKVVGKSIGLEQMRTRILYLNGQIDMTSSKGKGVKYQIKLPKKGGLAV